MIHARGLFNFEFQTPESGEADLVKIVVQSKIIENWEAQDEPEHLRTIRSRILSDEQRVCRLLGLYQQILQLGEVEADGSPEQMELRLSGLVVEKQGKLRVYNRIYESVFDDKWVGHALSDLRPYAEALSAWIASNYQDESQLLRSQALRGTQAWAAGKSLSIQDYQFLNASQELETREAKQRANQLIREAKQKAKQQIVEAKQKAKQQIRVSSTILAMSIIGAMLIVLLAVNALTTAQIQQWNLASENLLGSNQQLEALITSVKAGRQLQGMIGVQEKDLKYRTANTLQLVINTIVESNRLQGHDRVVNSVNFSPDGKTIASASSDQTIKLWNRDGALLKTLKGHTDRVTSLSFSPDGKTIASASYDKTIRLWKIGSLPSVLQGNQGHPDEFYSVSFSPSGKTIASASRDKIAKLWSWNGKEITDVTTLTGHIDRVWSVRFSPDGKTIATASWDKTIKLWSWDGKEITDVTTLGGEGKEGHTGWVFGISFSLDGQTIASVGSDRNVILWDLKNKKIKNSWKSGHKANVVDVSFSPDGKMIATASDDKTVKLWRYPNGKYLTTLQKHLDEVNGVSFSPDRKMIATASDDRTVKLWSYPDGKYLTTLQGHNERVMNARFSPNGKVIATASFDRTVKLWKPDGTLFQTFSGHNDWVWDVSFSPNSKTLASASRDKTIRLWHLDGIKQQSSNIDSLLTDGCKWLHDYLTTNPNIENSNRHICDR